MSRSLLIFVLFLASLTASAHTALAQTDKPEKKGPLGGLLEPWDGTGDEITPKTIHLGGVFQPWHETPQDRPRQEPSTGPAAKKKTGILQPWNDKPDDKAANVAKTAAPVVRKNGLFGGLLQPWDSGPDAP